MKQPQCLALLEARKSAAIAIKAPGPGVFAGLLSFSRDSDSLARTATDLFKDALLKDAFDCMLVTVPEASTIA